MQRMEMQQVRQVRERGTVRVLCDVAVVEQYDAEVEMPRSVWERIRAREDGWRYILRAFLSTVEPCDLDVDVWDLGPVDEDEEDAGE